MGIGHRCSSAIIDQWDCDTLLVLSCCLNNLFFSPCQPSFRPFLLRALSGLLAQIEKESWVEEVCSQPHAQEHMVVICQMQNGFYCRCHSIRYVISYPGEGAKCFFFPLQMHLKRKAKKDSHLYTHPAFASLHAFVCVRVCMLCSSRWIACTSNLFYSHFPSFFFVLFYFVSSSWEQRQAKDTLPWQSLFDSIQASPML